MALADTSKLPPAHRRWTRTIGFSGIPLIILGAVVGITLRPAHNIFKSELIGCGVAGGLWVIAGWTTALRAAPRKSQDSRRT